jgi:hypothetical protein
MYKSFTYLVVTCFPTYLPIYEAYIFPTELVTKVKLNINWVEVHPQLSKNGRPVDGALVVAGPSLWPSQSASAGNEVSGCGTQREQAPATVRCDHANEESEVAEAGCPVMPNVGRRQKTNWMRKETFVVLCV